MPSTGIATGFIGVIAAVFAASSILLNNLLKRTEDLYEEEIVKKHQKTAFFSIAAAFTLLPVGFGLLSSHILSDVVHMSLLSIDFQVSLYIGALCMVAAVSFPTYAASYVSWEIFHSIRE